MNTINLYIVVQHFEKKEKDTYDGVEIIHYVMFRCVCKRNNKVQPSKARSEWVRHPFDPRETKQETQSLFFFIKKAPTVPRLATIIDTFNLSALNCVHTQAHSKYTGNNAKFAAASLPDGAATFDDLWQVIPPPPPPTYYGGPSTPTSVLSEVGSKLLFADLC